MPNTFTFNPGSAGKVVCQLYDSLLVRQDRQQFMRDEIADLEYANSLYVPAGRWLTRGWILLRRQDYNLITNLYRTDFQLQIDDLVHPPLIFKNLAIVQARCVTRGLAADPNAIYLVEITDGQGVMFTPWFAIGTNSQYNVRAPAYPEQYYSATLNGSVPWTWNGMVGDLWNQASAYLGTFPGLPTTPAGTPENFIFPGVPLWLAINQVLDLLGMTIAEDLTQNTPYTIVQIGAADANFTAQQAKYAGLLEEDFEWIDSGSGRIPGTMIVYFHIRNQYYGTEETVRRDVFQWATVPLYSVTVPAPAQFASAQGVGYLIDDFTVRQDIDGNPLAADVATAASIATERVTQYYNKAYRGTVGYMRQLYAGALPFVAGSQVDGVRWFQDYRRGEFGWNTGIIRGPQPPWPQLSGEMPMAVE
jgi:hypothetical protein